jgi:hypothetical protein
MSARTDFAVLGTERIARDMGVLFHHPLSRPARFVGSVDATRDSERLTPRSLEQCRGMQRSSTAVLELADAPPAYTLADKVLFVIGAVLFIGLPFFCHFT